VNQGDNFDQAGEGMVPEAAIIGEPEIPLASIDLNALWVVRRLRAKGFEAYLTGGCVRDLLLAKSPKDFDVATNAKPEEIKHVFRNCRLIGRRFLLAHIFFPGGKIIETATFRANPTDVAEDLPEDLLVTHDNVFGNIEEDARRRDLTINGLFYDPVSGKVLDFVGGRDDLKAGIVRTIGDPDIRFQEDPVRILRAIKFASRLKFNVEENTLSAMQKHAGEIARCAPARVQEELTRLLSSGHSEFAMQMCRQVGILDVLMPELAEVLKAELPVEEGGTHLLASSIEEREKYWLATLRALDAVSERKADVATSVAFAALLLPAYEALEQSTQNERNWIDRLCVNWADRIRLARHDQDRIRLLLSAIPLFSPAKLQQKSAHYILRKPWFREALLLYILHLTARGESLTDVGRWKALAHADGKPYKQDRVGTRKFKPRFRRRRSGPRDRDQRDRGKVAEQV